MKEVKGGYVRKSTSDEMRLVGVMQQGYGIIPKMVMKDKDLSIEAKAIYAYFCSYAGAGNTAFPSVSLICSDLNISENRYRKHRKKLLDKGYLKVRQQRAVNGFSKNIYTLPMEVVDVSRQFVGTQNVGTQNVSTQNVSIQNDSINNNSINNNSLNNNSLNNNSLNNNKENNNNDDYDNIKSADAEKRGKKVSSSFGEIIQLYEELVPGSLNSFIVEKMEYDFEEHGLDLMKKAFEIAALNNKRNYNYISGILRNWKNKGIHSVEELELHESQRTQPQEEQDDSLDYYKNIILNRKE